MRRIEQIPIQKEEVRQMRKNFNKNEYTQVKKQLIENGMNLNMMKKVHEELQSCICDEKFKNQKELIKLRNLVDDHD